MVLSQVLRSLTGFPLIALLPPLPSDDLTTFQASTPATSCEASLIPGEQTQLPLTPKQRSAGKSGRDLLSLRVGIPGNTPSSFSASASFLYRDLRDFSF